MERSYKGIKTAFKATSGKGRPNVAVLCEYDALPGIGHACGHNLISECGVGAGIAIKEVLEQNPAISGTVNIFHLILNSLQECVNEQFTLQY